MNPKNWLRERKPKGKPAPHEEESLDEEAGHETEVEPGLDLEA